VQIKAAKQELLAKLASKEELQEVKKDLVLALQVALNTNKIEKLEIAVGVLQVDVAEIKQELAESKESTNEKLDLVLRGIERVMGKSESNETEKAAATHAFRRHENRHEDHEVQIRKLESIAAESA